MRLLLLILLLPACVPSDPPADPPSDPPVDPCASSVPGSTDVFATGFGGTEGLTFSDDGRLFVGDGDAIVEVQPDGSWAQIATVPASIGQAWWGGRLMVASSDDGQGRDGVYAVDVDSGDATLFASVEGANFLTVTPWDTLLVTDPGVDGVLEVDAEGGVTPWLPGQRSPNGAGFNEAGDALWIATTYGEAQPLWRVPVQDGAPGTPEVAADFGSGDVGDGLAVGASGAVYLAQNIGGRIDRIGPDGAVSTLSEGVPWAASLAFGEGAWDRCSVYVTSLFSGDLFRVEVGEVGLPPRRGG